MSVSCVGAVQPAPTRVAVWIPSGVPATVVCWPPKNTRSPAGSSVNAASDRLTHDETIVVVPGTSEPFEITRSSSDLVSGPVERTHATCSLPSGVRCRPG